MTHIKSLKQYEKIVPKSTKNKINDAIKELVKQEGEGCYSCENQEGGFFALLASLFARLLPAITSIAPHVMKAVASSAISAGVNAIANKVKQEKKGNGINLPREWGTIYGYGLNPAGNGLNPAGNGLNPAGNGLTSSLPPRYSGVYTDYSTIPVWKNF
jgi:hypothetical protein